MGLTNYSLILTHTYEPNKNKWGRMAPKDMQVLGCILLQTLDKIKRADANADRV